MTALNNEPENKLMREKNEIKFECKRLEMKLQKLDAELDYFDEQESENLKRRNTNTDSTQIMIDKNQSLDLELESKTQSKSGFITEDGGSRLLDFISGQSILSGGMTEITENLPQPQQKNLETPTPNLCPNCEGLIQQTENIIMPSETVSSESIETEIGQDILRFETEVNEINNRMRPYYEKVHKIIKKMVSKVYNRPFEVKIFGSCANGLNLPGSDLDLLIILKDFEQKIENSRRLSDPKGMTDHQRKHSEQLGTQKGSHAQRKYTEHSNNFQNPNSYKNIPSFNFPGSETERWDFELRMASEQILEEMELNALRGENFEEAKYLRSAMFPVLKLKTCSELGSLMVDVTVKDSRHQGLQCVELVKHLQTKLPRLKPLVLVLKQLLNAADLSDPYLGGLSSYGLVLMVAAYLKSSGDTKSPEIQDRDNKKNEINKNQIETKTTGKKNRNRKKGGKNRKKGKRISLWSNQNNEVLSIPNSLQKLEPNSKQSQQQGKLNETKTTLSTSHTPHSRKDSSNNLKSTTSAKVLGKRLMGFLKFFGAKFDYSMQKVSLEQDINQERNVFPMVNLTRNLITPFRSMTQSQLAFA